MRQSCACKYYVTKALSEASIWILSQKYQFYFLNEVLHNVGVTKELAFLILSSIAFVSISQLPNVLKATTSGFTRTTEKQELT